MENVERDYYENGNLSKERYFKDRELHRIDGPACIEYYESGEVKVERYFQNGDFHREDGPAIVDYRDGSIKEEYWIEGKRYKDIFQYLVIVGSLKGE